MSCVRAHRCDREDRHRGLCNHRATIAGPTAIPTTASASSELEEDSEDEEQEGQGTSQMDAGAQCCLCVVALVRGAPGLQVRCAQLREAHARVVRRAWQTRASSVDSSGVFMTGLWGRVRGAGTGRVGAGGSLAPSAWQSTQCRPSHHPLHPCGRPADTRLGFSCCQAPARREPMLMW